MKPSSKTARKARLTRLFKEYQAEFRTIRIVSADVHEVIFSYAGETVDFIWRDGYFTRGSKSGRYLSEDDYAFMLTLAKEIMEAVLTAHKERAKKKKLQEETDKKLKVLKDGGAQLDLFRDR